MSRLLWLGDGGCHTGFGRVTHSIGERLVRDYGHDIHVLAVNHLGDSFPSILDPTQQTPLKLYMASQNSKVDIYGALRILEMLRKLGQSEPGLDAVVMLNDPQVILQLLFENPADPERMLLQYRPILSYVPCDGTNLPPVWKEVLPQVTNVVAMSQWGASQYEPSKLAYHGVDTDKLWPVREKPIKTSTGEVLRTKKDCKRAFGMDPDAFVIGRVDKNSGRKDYGSLLRAVGPLMQRHKDIQLYLHCAQSELGTGINIPLTASRWLEDDEVGSRIHQPAFHNTFIGWPEEDMNALYNAFDVFVSTSRGEGFGLTLAEAAACAVPVIAQNVSAIPEVVGPGGILIEPSGVMVTVPSGEDVWMSDVNAFSEAIEHLHQAGGTRRKLGEAGLEHVRKSFSWDVAAAKFHEYISGLTSPAKEVLTHG